MAQRNNFLSTKLVLSNLAAPKEYHIPPRLSRGIRTPRRKSCILWVACAIYTKNRVLAGKISRCPKSPSPSCFFMGSCYYKYSRCGWARPTPGRKDHSGYQGPFALCTGPFYNSEWLAFSNYKNQEVTHEGLYAVGRL